MKLILQRVLSASVQVNRETVGKIDKGYVILLGVDENDSYKEAKILSAKVVRLRIFEDDNGKMNKSILDVDGEALIVSNFTLCADCRTGRRPSFAKAKKPAEANELYEKFCEFVKISGIKNVERGIFGADMKVELINDGPVTIILDTKELMNK